MCKRARRLGQGITIAIVLAGTKAVAQPVHIVTDELRLICKPPPSTQCREVPPGHFVDTGSWDKLDAELRRSQNAETGLRAENKSLRTAVSGWTPGWKTITAALVVGLAGGIYLGATL